MNKLNQSGEVYLTHTKIGNKIALRACFGQTYLEKKHVEFCWKSIQSWVQKTKIEQH